MTEKRFNIEDGYYQGKSRPIIYDEESSDDYYFCGDYEDFKSICEQFNDFDITNKHLKKENRALKQVIKEVLKLLEEEVDLFSDKATEHDINAYIELRELDNKDAYYMAISTKKAIKLLKEMM